jgi:hypothetical protein
MNIILHEIDSISVGIDKKDGYLNATKLCTAYNNRKGTNKIPRDWLSTKRAKEYIAYVSSVTTITQTLLVVVKQGGGIDEQGTWIHPDLANAFSSWLSVEYEYEVGKWVADWKSLKASNTFPEKLVGQIDKSPELVAVEIISGTIDMIMGHSNMNPNIIAGVKCSAIAETYPQLRIAMEVVKKNLLLPVASNLLSPTDLTKIWEEQTGEKLSAIAFNRKLETANLQKKSDKKDLPWIAIGCGIDHSEVVLDTAKGHAKTVQRLMWHESVLELLINS